MRWWMILLIAGALLLLMVAVVVVVIVIVVKKYVVYLGLLNCITATRSRFSSEVGAIDTLSKTRHGFTGFMGFVFRVRTKSCRQLTHRTEPHSV